MVLRAVRGQEAMWKSFSHFGLHNFATVILAKLSHIVDPRVVQRGWQEAQFQGGKNRLGPLL